MLYPFASLGNFIVRNVHILYINLPSKLQLNDLLPKYGFAFYDCVVRIEISWESRVSSSNDYKLWLIHLLIYRSWNKSYKATFVTCDASL